jgi:hypothetical protein
MRRAVTTGVVQMVTAEFHGRRYQHALTQTREAFVRDITAERTVERAVNDGYSIP